MARERRVRWLISSITGVVEWATHGAATAWVTLQGLFGSSVRAEILVSALERIDITTKTSRKTFFDLPIRAAAVAVTA